MTTVGASAAYAESVRDLLKLHALMSSGNAESSGAQSLRDRMVDLWQELSADESARLRGLSADLFVVDETVPWPPSLAVDEVPSTFEKAFQSRDWASVLASLRPPPRKLPRHGLAYLRGRAWQGLGHHDVAAVFFLGAAKLDPAHVSYSALAMEALAAGGDAPAALALARRVMADPTAHTHQLIVAAKVLFAAASAATPPERTAAYGAVLAAVERGLELQKKVNPKDRLRSTTLTAHLLAALTHARLDDPSAALRSYQDALLIEPDNPEILTAIGWLLSKSDPDAAALHLQRAVDGAAQMPFPYVFLAHRALTQGEFRTCWGFAQKGLEHAGRPETRAVLYEWAAIALANLGGDPAEVRRLFQVAWEEDPANLRISRNRDIFERSTTSDVSPEWQSDDPGAWATDDDALPNPARAA